VPPLRCPFPLVYPLPQFNTWFLGPTRVCTQTTSLNRERKNTKGNQQIWINLAKAVEAEVCRTHIFCCYNFFTTVFLQKFNIVSYRIVLCVCNRTASVNVTVTLLICRISHFKTSLTKALVRHLCQFYIFMSLMSELYKQHTSDLGA